MKTTGSNTGPSKVYLTGYKTVQNYVSMLEEVCAPPALPAVNSFKSDQDLLDALGRAYTEILAKLDSEIQKKDGLEKMLSDTKLSILKRQHSRKEQTLKVEKSVENLNNLIQKEQVWSDVKVDGSKRNEELLEKFKKLQERESKALSKRDQLVKEEESFYAENLNLGGLNVEEEKNKLLEEITILEMQVNHLISEKQRIAEKHSVILNDEMRTSLVRQGIRSMKESLSTKVKTLHGKNDKRENHYWNLLAQQQELAVELQNVDREMEELRISNSKMQIATEQLDVLGLGLDQQEKINSIQ